MDEDYFSGDEVRERLQKQVLYYDTDSVIYRWKEGQPQIDIGDYLGDMTDELDGDVIVEFVSGGPKNYAYQTERGKTECKVRVLPSTYVVWRP